jgi:methylmalonyl-CoA/ethylmalonyl-CoA epimerase
MIGKKNILGSNVITQIGFVVRDIEKSATEFAEFFGVKKPGISITGPVEETHGEYNGKPLEGKAKLAFFRFKNITIELIEPVDGPSTWQEFLDVHGEGVHHLGINVRDSKGKIEALKGKSVPLVQHGDFKGGDYAYLDATGPLKIIIELLGHDVRKL